MRDALARTLDDADKRLREVNAAVDRASALMTNAGARIDEFQKKSEAALADVFSTGARTEARLKKLIEDARHEIQALTGQVSTAKGKMEKQFVALSTVHDRRFSELQQRFSDSEADLQGQLKEWTAEQDVRLVSFREEHAAALRAVQEAYDRAKARLESHVPLFDRLEGKVDNLIERQAESAAALRTELEQSRAEMGRQSAELLPGAANV